MELNKNKISKIISGSERFCSPYGEPDPYYIIGNNEINSQTIHLYYNKLEFAVKNADILIENAFDNKFYDFYGVNKDIVSSPKEMFCELYFDSFILNTEDDSVGTCLSNKKFMFGHFIEIWWNNEWKIISSRID